MSLIKNHKSMISLNLSLTVPQYEDLNNYIEMWKEKTGLDLSVESFLMGNVYYWTHEETGKRKQPNEEDLNNILSDEFQVKIKAIEKGIMERDKTNINLSLDSHYMGMLEELKKLTEMGINEKTNYEKIIQMSINYSFHSIILGEG